MGLDATLYLVRQGKREPLKEDLGIKTLGNTWVNTTYDVYYWRCFWWLQDNLIGNYGRTDDGNCEKIYLDEERIDRLIDDLNNQDKAEIGGDYYDESETKELVDKTTEVLKQVKDFLHTHPDYDCYYDGWY